MEAEISTWMVGGGSLAVIGFFARRLVMALDRVTDCLSGIAVEISAHTERLNNLERQVYR